jgi:alpha-tubulin N-acetyltransferase 1
MEFKFDCSVLFNSNANGSAIVDQ